MVFFIGVANFCFLSFVFSFVFFFLFLFLFLFLVLFLFLFLSLSLSTSFSPSFVLCSLVGPALAQFVSCLLSCPSKKMLLERALGRMPKIVAPQGLLAFLSRPVLAPLRSMTAFLLAPTMWRPSRCQKLMRQLWASRLSPRN